MLLIDLLNLVTKERYIYEKTTTIVLSFLFLVLNTAKADFAVGITGAFHNLMSGTETTSNGQKISSHTGDVVVPELFIETTSGSGFELD